MSTSTSVDLSPERRELLDMAVTRLQLTGSSLEQFRRYVRDYLQWCDSEGAGSAFTDELARRYREHLERGGKLPSERAWRVRRVYLNKLPGLLAEQQRLHRLGAQKRRTRLIDALPDDSALALAIRDILAQVTPGYRRSLRSDLAYVLDWCASVGISPTSIGAAELQALRVWLAQRGRRSGGPMVAARRLHFAFYEPMVWWR